MLVVTEQGDYRLGERRLPADSLASAMAGDAEQARQQGLIVEADARARHADVVRALDAAGSLGIRQVRIATRAAPATPTQAETP